MRTTGISIVLALAATVAVSQLPGQQPAAQMKLFASSGDIAAMMAKAKNERKDQPTISQRILQLSPYNVNLEYRAAVGPASVHATEAEMFYVVDGSGTLVTGGKLVKESQTNANNFSGTAIEGGNAQRVAKGDFIMVPENTPHWFSKIDGVLTLMSMHLAHPVPGKK